MDENIMENFIRYKSVLLKNDKKHLVELNEWAEMTLEGAELDQYYADYQEFSDFYDQLIFGGELKVTTLKDFVEIENNIRTEIDIGWHISFKNSKIIHPKEEYWWDRLSKDPNIIKYNREEPVE